MRGTLSAVTCFVLLFAAAGQGAAQVQPAQNPSNPVVPAGCVANGNVVVCSQQPSAQSNVAADIRAAQEPAVARQPAAANPAPAAVVPAVVAPAQAVVPAVNPQQAVAAAVQPVAVPAPAAVQPAAVPAPAAVQPAAVPAPAAVQPAAVPAPAAVQPAAVPAPAAVQPAAVPAPAAVQPAAVPAPAAVQPAAVPALPAVQPAAVPAPAARPAAVPAPAVVAPVVDEPAADADPPAAVPEPVVVVAAPVAEREDEKAVKSLASDAETDLLDKHPYVVSLRRRSDLGYICAGVVIGRKSKHVLTAAHCVDAFLLNGDVMPRVVVGSDSPSGRGVQVIGSAQVDFNPGSPAGRPDIAIVTLKKAAKVRPAALPTVRFQPAPDSALTAFGWGRKNKRGRTSKVLKATSMKYVVKETCEMMRGKFIPSFNICMGGKGKGTCKGDNGGPIILDGSPDLVVAVVGEDHACGEPIIDVHASVADAMEWIESIVGPP